MGGCFTASFQGFMAQTGCPTGDGYGGPGYTIYCECRKENHRNHFADSVAMAHSGPDTGGSQFYLMFNPKPQLNGRHTVFGRVIEGRDVLMDIQRYRPGSQDPQTAAGQNHLRRSDPQTGPRIQAEQGEVAA